MNKLVCFLLATVISVSALPSPSDFEIDSLPLLSADISFKQYAGLMPVGDDDETALFFWFVESQNDPTNDPVVLWMNGGPGSSSVEYGFWGEHGPFRLTEGAASVEPYDQSWNRIANVIYLESPSGVGFSYSNKSSGYNCSDEKSADINYRFLIQFFLVFSDFTSNDFYVTGESYGGHYVPQLSWQLLFGNDMINMKGFLIGNPGINSDWYYNVNEYAFQTFLWSHALLPQSAWLKSNEACDWNEFLTNCEKDFTHPDRNCQIANAAAYPYIPSSWDPYNIYAPTCHPNRTAWSYLRSKYGRVLAEDAVKEYTPWLHRLKEEHNLKTDYIYNPCMNQWAPEYMNRQDVLEALHVSDHYDRVWPHHPKGWTYGDEKENIALLFPTFFKDAPDWRITVVSGDADSAVPFVGSERWIECLGRDIVHDWDNWWLDQDVAGSVITYDGLVFQTVKECGHTIPTYCPEQGFLFFKQFLDGTFL